MPLVFSIYTGFDTISVFSRLSPGAWAARMRPQHMRHWSDNTQGRKRMSLPVHRFTRFVSAGVVNRAFCEVGALQTLAERLGQAQPMYGQRFFQTLAQGCAADGLISSSHSTVSSSLGLSYSFIACAAPSSHEPPALPGSRGTSILLIGVYFGLQTDGAFLKTQPTL